jgi:hypothetical protein
VQSIVWTISHFEELRRLSNNNPDSEDESGDPMCFLNVASAQSTNLHGEHGEGTPHVESDAPATAPQAHEPSDLPTQEASVDPALSFSDAAAGGVSISDEGSLKVRPEARHKNIAISD